MEQNQIFDFIKFNDAGMQWVRRVYLFGVYAVSIYVFQSVWMAVLGGVIFGYALYQSFYYDDYFELANDVLIQKRYFLGKETIREYPLKDYTIYVSNLGRKFSRKKQYMVTIQNKTTQKLIIIPIDGGLKNIKYSDFAEEFTQFKAFFDTKQHL